MPEGFTLITVEVPATDVEYASHILWLAGAQAVEEQPSSRGVRLVTDLGIHPLDRWHEISSNHFVPQVWAVDVVRVEARLVDSWRAHAQPTFVAGVRIMPAWLCEAGGPTDILIEPGGSFGLGDHPTTQATLELALEAEGSSVLDLGCGSGVLAISLAKLRGFRAVAADIAPAAIEATTHNAQLNGVSDRIVIQGGDVRVVRGTYDLVLANILAPVLLADASEITRRIATHGSLIVSGFTASRLDDIVDAYQDLGLRRSRLIERDGWLALQMESP